MPQFSYRAFLWVFAVSNAIVWFALLCGLALFLHAHFAHDGQITRQVALPMLCLGWLLPTVLSLQGAIVNLRAQFLDGRFLPPAETEPVAGNVRNPWQVAIGTAALFWSVGLPLCWVGLSRALPERLGTHATVLAMAGIGAAFLLVVIVYVADREFRAYLAVIKEGPPVRVPVSMYVVRNIALPWGVVNLVINAVLAWIAYAGPRGTAVADLRLDLTVMAFLISVCMALSALPEVATDVHRKRIELPDWLPSIPRLWMRYGYAVAIAFVTYMIFTAATAAASASTVPLPATIIIKAVSSGIIAAGTAGACALWGLGRCADRCTADRHPEPLAPMPAIKANTEVV